MPPLSFVCNVCDRANLAAREALTREAPSCTGCGSSVRLRALVHLLSRGLFGRSLALRDFPYARSLRGLGLGDWPAIAAPLGERLGYLRVDDPRAPWSDPAFAAIAPGSLDFVLASDALQLVAPPVQRAFDDLRRWLRPGGLLVLTAPFDPAGPTREHFPGLHEHVLVEEAGRRRLYNVRRDGQREAFDALVFHGPGDRLEMRLFGLRDLLAHCAGAGFQEAAVQADEVPERGIVWRHPWSVPIVARA